VRPSSPSSSAIFVLDTAAFIARLHLMLYNADIYTAPKVIEEVRDRESVEGLEIGFAADRVRVLEPEISYISEVLDAAKRLNIAHKLSETDIQLAALALKISKEKRRDVIVVTDDYAIQLLVEALGLKFMPVKTVGIRFRSANKNLSIEKPGTQKSAHLP